MSIHTPIELNTCATKPEITVELVPASRLRPQRCEQDREAAERPGWGSNKPCFRPLLSYSDPLVSLTPFPSISVAATPPQGQALFPGGQVSHSAGSLCRRDALVDGRKALGQGRGCV